MKWGANRVPPHNMGKGHEVYYIKKQKHYLDRLMFKGRDKHEFLIFSSAKSIHFPITCPLSMVC